MAVVVRNMLGRLSSTDKTLRLRMRLASNPGSIGAAWHKTMFLRGACPVHNPEKSAEAGKLYWDGLRTKRYRVTVSLRYSFIGFDESTFHSEYQIRNMLGRLSSTDD